jgi:cytosine/adenosine deaminase-related metal-dependent hydrolase
VHSEGTIRYVFLPVVLLGCCLAALGQQPPIVFVDVSVIPMDSQHILLHQTVIVRNGRIAAIGASDSLRLPKNALRIDGTGRFLLPRLVDMHGHFLRPPGNGKNEAAGFSDEPNYQKLNGSFALLFAANGVTTVRVTWGHTGTDEINERILHEEFIGPRIYSTGPITDGNPPSHPGTRVVTNAEQARQAVRDDKAHGYIATKVYDNLTLEMYRAIVDEARLQHFPVVGHIPFAVPLDEVIRSHQSSIEHAESFLGRPSTRPLQGQRQKTQ